MTQLVLVVDDTQIARRGTALTLRQLYSYEVVEAGDGYSALDILKSRRCAAVLMDIEMPGMNGFQCTEHIRELEKLTGERTVIIAMTSTTRTDVREKCLQAGMDDYLDKGCSAEDLHHTIQKWGSAEQTSGNAGNNGAFRSSCGAQANCDKT